MYSLWAPIPEYHTLIILLPMYFLWAHLHKSLTLIILSPYISYRPLSLSLNTLPGSGLLAVGGEVGGVSETIYSS